MGCRLALQLFLHVLYAIKAEIQEAYQPITALDRKILIYQQG